MHPEARLRRQLATLILCTALAGCATLPPPWQGTGPAAVLAYADRVASLPAAERANEIARLGEGRFTPARGLQLASALLCTGQPEDEARAQALVQRVLDSEEDDAAALQPLARVLARIARLQRAGADAAAREQDLRAANTRMQAQLATQADAQHQAERRAADQAQQLHDAQRRIDELSARLEALRSIERSLPSSPESALPAARQLR